MWLTSRLRNFRLLKRQIGPASACEVMLSSACDRGARVFGSRFKRPAVRLEVRGYDHPLFLRPGTSDLSAFLQIFTHGQYECLSYLENPKLIVDCGANVGYASAYLLNRFPTARVVAVEPDAENAETCRMNLSPYGDRVQILTAAVWDRPTELALRRNLAGREWSTHVVEAPSGQPGGIKGVDIASIIRLGGGLRVDLLKIDIEGAEVQLFQNGAGRWLPDVRNIAIELHSAQCREVFFAALEDFQYDLFCFSELTICRNLRRRS